VRNEGFKNAGMPELRDREQKNLFFVNTDLVIQLEKIIVTP